VDPSGSDTAATLTSVTGAGSERDQGEIAVRPDRPVHPYIHVVVVAVIGGLSVRNVAYSRVPGARVPLERLVTHVRARWSAGSRNM
jgi:hypothetical protein